jgi:hypothetical protein
MAVALCVKSPTGIAQIRFDKIVEDVPTAGAPVMHRIFDLDYLSHHFDRSKSLRLYAWCMNGKLGFADNVWRVLAAPTRRRVPNSSVSLYQRSIGTTSSGEHPNSKNGVHEWAQLLRERGPDGNIYRATSINLCVGLEMGRRCGEVRRRSYISLGAYAQQRPRALLWWPCFTSDRISISYKYRPGGN